MGDKDNFLSRMKLDFLTVVLVALLIATSSAKPNKGKLGKVPKNEVGCTTCKILVQAITNFMTDPTNEAALGDNLRQICSLLFANDPVTLGECDAWIVEYTLPATLLSGRQFEDIICMLLNWKWLSLMFQ